MKDNHSLIHKTCKKLRELEVGAKHHLAVAVSGGADSVALVHVLSTVQNILKFSLSIYHVHHGPAPEDEVQTNFRHHAQCWTRELAESLNLPFFTNEISLQAIGNSEEDFRNFRYGWMQKWLNQERSSVDQEKLSLLVLAHHADDALETRLIRLIRGSGESGIFGMKMLDNQRLRPFLSISRREILDYLQNQNRQWLEDPSNNQIDALRNWVRHSWLPQLEDHCPGGVQVLSRSLEILAEAVSDTQSQLPLDQMFVGGEVQRQVFERLSHNEKKRAMAFYLSQLGIKNYTSGQISEFLKRLDTSQKHLTFQLFSLKWIITADHIQASRV